MESMVPNDDAAEGRRWLLWMTDMLKVANCMG